VNPDTSATRLETVLVWSPVSPLGSPCFWAWGVVSGTWTLESNFVWLQQAIANGDVFYLASPVVEETLGGSPQFGGVSVFMRELDTLVDAGYRRVGAYLVPPR
jgi:hypothetical protein